MDESRSTSGNGPSAEVGGGLLPLSVEELSYVSGGRTILDRVTCLIEAGQRTVILGANGAGKSVFMRLCHGLLAPTGGRIEWNRAEGAPRGQAMVFQRPVMLRRSALGNLVFALRHAGFPRAQRRERAQRYLEEVGLAEIAGTPARVLSGGEQQRLALARAWVTEPEVLFLDEPTANLDPGSARDIEALIAKIHRAGTKIVMSTHNLGQARRLGDEILFFENGRLLEQSSGDCFFRQPKSEEAAAFLAEELP